MRDLASLLWVVNLRCIDLKPWYARREDIDRPIIWLFVIALIPGLLVMIFGILGGLVWLVGRLIDSVFSSSDPDMFLPLSPG